MAQGGKEVISTDVEMVESVSDTPVGNNTGTVKLLDKNKVVLIPTPSPDPMDPLNLPTWRKVLIIIIVGLFSSFSVVVTSGLAPVFNIVAAMYPGQETRATDLMTYPTLFMGIGNLLSMPLCVAIGRRPVFLFSLLALVLSGIWCACAKTLDVHMAGRAFLALAAGQSEALAPMIVQEVHFLHQRANRLGWFVAIQTTGTAGLFIATTYMVPAWGLAWWYWLTTIFDGVLLVLAFVFVVETKFDRPTDANDGAVHVHFDDQGNPAPLKEAGHDKIYRVTTAEEREIEPGKYGKRTWRRDMRIFSVKPHWPSLVQFYKDTFYGLAIPSAVWMVLINGAFLGVYVFQSSTFANVLTAPPFSFREGLLGFIQMAQIIDCLIMLPLMGYGSDILVKWMSRRYGGGPEYRLIPLVLPALATVIGCAIFGQASAHPFRWSWPAVVVPYHMCYFAFLGVNLVAITYAIDSFPAQAGPMLLLICAGRGFISFGLSYSTVPAVHTIGYDGGMNVFAAVCGAFSLAGVAVYFWGNSMRNWAHKRIWKEDQE
ncbi:hypothetical protein SEUCBS139899_000509 [Sporothrix eucalyptigena]